MGQALGPEHQRLLAQGIEGMGLAIGLEPQGRLLEFLALLERWNGAYNLTAVRDLDAMITRHLLDSLSVLPHLFGERVLDLGTGAGLPGLPLAIVDPARRFWLLDSNAKKVRFVRQAVMDLGLSNVEPVHARSESYRPGVKFSTIVTRAVAAAGPLWVQAADLLAHPGRMLLMKGRYPDLELADPALAATDPEVHRVQVPFLDGERHLIELRRD